MTALPLFLLSALILFCGGLSLLLAICMIGFIFLFYAFTTILPSICDACPYRSPQAFWVFVLIQAAFYVYLARTRWVCGQISPSPDILIMEREFADLKLCPTRSAVGGPATELPKPSSWMRLCEWAERKGGQRTYWSWREREEATLLCCRKSYRMDPLDELDSVKMDVALLQDVVRPCLLTLPLDEAIPCFHNILNRRAEVVVQGLPKWESDLDRETCRALVDMLLDMFARPELSLDSSRTAPMVKNLLQKHEEVLGMLNRLIGTGHHRTFLNGSYDRIFGILLPYIREPQRQHISTEEATIPWLVMMTLASLQDRIPPNAVTKEDVVTVSKHVFSAVETVVSLRSAALAFSMIPMSSSTGDDCSEDLFEVVRSMIMTSDTDLRRATASRDQASGDDLIRILPSLHVYLSSLEAPIRMSPQLGRVEEARARRFLPCYALRARPRMRL
ncbi:hypothetical protein LXA43DRAFT_391294 [Ganoderma leucocontextum]|nr:hypothetical protein LXA43DRAFT_391294 [Ganoderma leucocontextum]